MRGKVEILRFGPIGFGDSIKEEGAWKYEDGMLTRGILFKETLNLAGEIKEINATPGGVYKKFIADVNAEKAYYLGAVMTGNIIGGMVSRSGKIKRIIGNELLKVILKDDRALLISTDRSILRNLQKKTGLAIKPFVEKNATNNR